MIVVIERQPALLPCGGAHEVALLPLGHMTREAEVLLGKGLGVNRTVALNLFDAAFGWKGLGGCPTRDISKLRGSL